MLRTALGLLLPVLLCISSQSSAGNDAPSSVKDLQYGEALYHYYQKDYFNSIVRMQIAQQQQRLPNHADEAELMLGGLNLSYGLRDSARRVFQRLLDENSEASVRNRAWFYLAKIAYQRGDLAQALEAIEHIDDDVSQTVRLEKLNLHSLLLLQQGRNAEAIELLQNSRSRKHWSPYLTYNLGVALMRDNRLEEGARQLDKVGELRGRNEELRLLRDKANLALGFSYLQNGDAELSRTRLERVRLQGPFSNKALLGTGWADAETEAYKRALTPWSELTRRNATDPAVQEALLAVPFAMTKLQLHGRAVQHYNDSISALVEERQKLDQSIQAIQNGALLELLSLQGISAGNGWQQQLSLQPETPALRYQVALMASHDFQEAVKNYLDLIVLDENLSGWASNMAAYDDMLATRQIRFEGNRPATAQALHNSALQQLEQRYAVLSDALAAIESADRPEGLANAVEAQHWQTLSDIGKRLDQLPVTPQTEALRDKQRRLRGILYWQLNSEYKPRLWESKQQLVALDSLIQQTRQARGNLEDAEHDAPMGFSGFSQRIAGQKANIENLLARTHKIRLAQGTLLEQLAVNELEQQKRRLDIYIIQARYSLAQTHDSALTAHPVEGVFQ